MSPKPRGWAAGPRCPPLPASIRSVHPSITSPSAHLPIPRPSAPPAVCLSILLLLFSALPSPPSSPPRRPSSFSRCARLQPSCPCRRSRPGHPSPWPGRPSPWHLGCGIPGAGICRGGGAGAAGAGRWERPREVQDGRQGMSIVHHRSRPGLTAPLGSGGGGGPGRAPRLLGLGQGGPGSATGPTRGPTPMCGVWLQPEKGHGKGGVQLHGWQVPRWHRYPPGMGIPPGQASH